MGHLYNTGMNFIMRDGMIPFIDKGAASIVPLKFPLTVTRSPLPGLDLEMFHYDFDLDMQDCILPSMAVSCCCCPRKILPTRSISSP